MWRHRLGLFISYRRDDARSAAGRLFDWLSAEFGAGRVFLDTAAIPFGEDFRRVVAERLATCDVVLAVIGPQWTTLADARGRRLDQPDDPVRYELERALAAGKRIVPVLVGGAAPPRADELPPSLQALAPLNMAPLRDDSFAADFDALLDELIGRRRGTVRTELDHLRRLATGAAGWALAAPLLALALAFAAWVGLFDLLELDTQAQRVLLAAGGSAAGDRVLLVRIDAASERALGREFGPEAQAAAWRADHARLVERAAAGGARAVVFDSFFHRETAADTTLAAAARAAAARGTRVVFGVREFDGARPRLVPALAAAGGWASLCLMPRGALWLSPLAVLRPAAGGGALVPAMTPSLALAAVADAPLAAADLARRSLDLDGPPRVPPLRFSLVQRQRAENVECTTHRAGDDVAALLIRVSPAARWAAGAQGVAYADALDAAKLPETRLAGRVLLVGAADTARPHRDRHAVAEGFGVRTAFGVELQADAVATLLADRVARVATADGQALSAVLASLLGAAVSLALFERPAWQRRALLAAAALGWLAVAFVLARRDLLIQPAYDLAALSIIYGVLRALQSLARRTAYRNREMP